MRTPAEALETFSLGSRQAPGLQRSPVLAAAQVVLWKMRISAPSCRSTNACDGENLACRRDSTHRLHTHTALAGTPARLKRTKKATKPRPLKTCLQTLFFFFPSQFPHPLWNRQLLRWRPLLAPKAPESGQESAALTPEALHGGWGQEEEEDEAYARGKAEGRRGGPAPARPDLRLSGRAGGSRPRPQPRSRPRPLSPAGETRGAPAPAAAGTAGAPGPPAPCPAIPPPTPGRMRRRAGPALRREREERDEPPPLPAPARPSVREGGV